MKHSKVPHWVRHRGFALVVTLSLMILLTVIAIGLLSLSSISLRSAAAGEAMAVARANARLAMMLAIGELQAAAGPDQRVTGTSELGNPTSPNPRWSAAWKTNDKTSGPVWLVSGNENGNLDISTKGDTPPLVTTKDGNVSVKTINLNRNGKRIGSYAWWIGDEGVKARVDLEAPTTPPTPELVRIVQSKVALENGIRRAGTALETLGTQPDLDKRRIISPSTLALAVGGAPDLPRDFYHDLTSGGASLPVNVVDGGVKTDLSLIFDSSQKSAGLTTEYFGASFTPKSVAGVSIDVASPTKPEKFFLAPEISEPAGNAGPNWGNLYSYAMLWKTLKGQESPVIRLNPKNECDVRKSDWPPYRNTDNGGSYKRDLQHTNSPVTPVISHLQIGFRMRAKSGVQYRDSKGVMKDGGYQLQLEMKPVIGIWNPYNVAIRSNQYRVDWALYPYLRLGVNDAAGNRIITKQGNVRFWLRELWPPGGDDVVNLQNRWLRLQTPAVDLQPGEIRLFSLNKDAQIDKVNNLVSSWGEDGGFRVDLTISKFDAVAPYTAGEPLAVPPGSVSWYGDMFLEDTQSPDTLKQFPDGLGDGASASWVTLKANDADDIQRVSDMWLTTGNQPAGKWRIPEQVISLATASGGSKTSPKIKVEQLAASPWHIATWAWSARTTTEAVDKQGTRGWADTNVRYAAANPVWDGSEGRSPENYDGWYFNSPMLGSSWGDPNKPFSKTSASGDKGPGGRGKVAEGQLGNQEPESALTNGRFQGFGGPSGSSTSGQSQIVLFDVPRAPLVSIGQFQHAQVARYGHEPSFPIGASYADPRVPLGAIYNDSLSNIANHRVTDLSFVLNRKLWDNYFFSTIGADYLGGGALDSRFPWNNLSTGKLSLPNPRHRFVPRDGDTSLNKIVKDAARLSPLETASRIMIEGGFNVNSTSKAAWKAVLSSMEDFEIPVLSQNGKTSSWESPEGVRLPRFGHVLNSEGWKKGTSGTDPSFWQSYRTITPPELDQLAGAIVEEVQARGPFRSFAEFVNRNPDSSRAEDKLKGPLQAALDRTINSSLPSDIGDPATQPVGDKFAAAINGENQACGFAGYLSQGDVLQCLAPVLGVRSDYFRIITRGEATDASGKVTATARCEAFVQRVPDYVDPADRPAVLTQDLKSPANRNFGRCFQLVSFRWLNASEI